MSEAAKLFTRSVMMGLDSGIRRNEFAEPSVEEIENMPYHEAVEYLKKRDVIKKVDYNKLSDKMRFRAFTASRINDGKLLERLNAEMIANVNDGKGLKDFLSMTKTDILDKVGMGPNQGWYWETVYRTNVQTAYNAGRAMGFAEDRPLALEFIGIDDARQTDVCHSLMGIIRPYDDPFWESHFPPLHFNCRSTVRAIYDEDELPEKWSKIEEVEKPAKGFGTYPLENDGWWNELESQVRQAKHYGVQGEIEAVKVALGVGSGQIKGLERNSKISDNSNEELERINVKTEKVENEIASVKRGHPMTFDEADNGNANPHYAVHSATSANCPACVLSMKARLEGFDVQARPYDEKSDLMFALSENTNIGLISKTTGKFPEYIKPKEKYMTRLLSWFDKNLEDNKYYSIEFYWKDFTPDGHIMMITKQNGILMLYDPQIDQRITGNKIKDFLYTTRLGTIKLLNLSDCFLNKTVVDYVLEARL